MNTTRTKASHHKAQNRHKTSERTTSSDKKTPTVQIASESSAGAASIKKSLLPVWWMAWLAILLLVFGVPSLTARLIGLSGNAVHNAMLEGKKPSTEELALLDASRRQVASWFPVNEYYNDLALVAIERASSANNETTAEFNREAELWERKALTVSPADPYGWYRLAYLYYLIDGPSSRAAAALRQSLASAPYEPRLTVPRLQMAMSLGSLIGEDMRAPVLNLITQAWQEDPDKLARIAAQGNYVSSVEAALRDDNESLLIFREMIKGK